MKTLSLAIRNLLRNRRRSLATLLALAIGSAAILIFGGYTTNVRYSMLTAYVRNGGHLQIQHRDFFHYGSGNPAAWIASAAITLESATRRRARRRTGRTAGHPNKLATDGTIFGDEVDCDPSVQTQRDGKKRRFVDS